MGANPTNSAKLLLLGVVLLLALAGCSGSQTTTTNTALNDQSGVATTTDGPFAGIPAIPIDGEEAFKVSSADGNTGDPPIGDPPPPGDPPTISVLGSEYLMMQGGYVDGTDLVLGDSSGSDMLRLGEGNNVAYGLYKIAGITGFRPVSLNVEALPQELGERYYIGVANYSDMHWDWFGPVTFPEFQLDLANSGNQYVTHLGNLYFIMIVMEGNIVRHERSSVVLGPLQPPARPGTPTNLQASDGAFPDMVELTWLPGMGADHYEVWRADPNMPPGDPNYPGNPTDPPLETNWMMIGETPDTMFHDPGVPPGVPFAYRVRAVNPMGVSDFSNVDIGFAAGGPPPPPPGDNIIEGFVSARVSPEGPSYPVGGVRMFLSGFPNDPPVFTDDGGYFHFEGVGFGQHVLAPVDYDHLYDPPYVVVDLEPSPDGGPVVVTVTFDGMNGNAHHRVWGFVHQSNYVPGGFDGSWVGMPGVDVTATFQGDADVALSGTTDGNGYFAFDAALDGPWLLTASTPNYDFMPPQIFFATPLPNPDSPPPPYIFEGMPTPGDPVDPPAP